jgi:DNA-binding NarL/FixJ family response regulator
MSARARMLLAEPDGPTRAGIRLALSRAGLEVVAEAGDRDNAIAVALEQHPDAALVSIELPGGGLELAEDLATAVPGTKVILLSSDPHGPELLAGVLAGAAGYLPKDISPDRLPHAVEGVLRGEVALPRRHTQHLIEALRGREIERTLVAAQADATLTDREWEVLRLLGEEASTAEMAHRLHISEVTVRRHVSSLLGKLNVRDRASAARFLRRSAD